MVTLAAVRLPPPPAVRRSSSRVVAQVDDYRHLSAGRRCGFGVFTGNAFVDAEARFCELPGQ